MHPCCGYRGKGNPSSSSGKGSRQSTCQVRVGLGRNDSDLLWQPAPALGWVCLLLVQTLLCTAPGWAEQASCSQVPLLHVKLTAPAEQCGCGMFNCTRLCLNHRFWPHPAPPQRCGFFWLCEEGDSHPEKHPLIS